jgi:hypothetical protein
MSQREESAPPRIITDPRTLAQSDLKSFERIDILFRNGALVGNATYLGMRLTEKGQRPFYEFQGQEQGLDWANVRGLRRI